MNIQEKLKNADNLIASGDYIAAKNLYNEIIEVAPECGEAWLILGSLHGESGDIDKATEYVEKAITISPDDANGHLILGQIKNSAEDFSAAELAFDKALECAPNDTSVICTLASLFQQRGELTDAIELFEQAVALDDTLVDAWAMLGPLHFQNNSLQVSETCYKKALSFKSTDPATFIGYCGLLNATDRSAEALQLLNNLPESERENPEVLLLFASAYVGEGRNSDALESIERAITQDPQDRFILSKADILQTMAEHEQAFEILKPYLQLETPNVSAVITLSKFCKDIGLEEECVQLLEKLLVDQQLALQSKQFVQSALEQLRS